MNLGNVLAMLKGLIPILEPLGEQGVDQLFQIIDGAIDKMVASDLKDAATIFSPAFKQFALIELKKLK